MKITKVDNCPTGLRYFEKDDLENKLEPQDVEDIVEIFQTPLTGSYNWDYTEADNRLSNSREEVEPKDRLLSAKHFKTWDSISDKIDIKMN